MKMRQKLKNAFLLCPARLLLLAVGLAVLALARLPRRDALAALLVAEGFTRPAAARLGRFWSAVPVSAGAWMVVLAAAFAAGWLVWQLWGLFRRPQKAARLWRAGCTVLCLAVWLGAGFDLLWGVYYYTGSFSQKSGLPVGAVTVSQLERATRICAEGLCRTADAIPRDEAGCAVFETDALLDDALLLYTPLEERWPFLKAQHLRPKPVGFGDLLSRLDTTGFYFPFTGEANINTHSPHAMRPFTIAHELAHQRGVGPEQEANFLGVLACVESGLPAYEYAGWLNGYLYLGNALYAADYEVWEKVWALLPEGAKADLGKNNRYWEPYDRTVTAQASGEWYDDFLKNYDQALGRRSYGACVDLLCAYFAPEP